MQRRTGLQLAAVALAVLATTSIVTAQPVSYRVTIGWGVNLISLPFDHQYQTLKDFCVLFGKTTDDTSLMQIDPYSGSIHSTWSCDQMGTPSALLNKKEVGIVIFEDGRIPVSATITGSHDPNYIVHPPDAGAFPKGRWVYNVPVNSCYGNGRGLCDEVGVWFDPLFLVTWHLDPIRQHMLSYAYTCDQVVPGMQLYAGEAVYIIDEFVHAPFVPFTPSVIGNGC